MNNFKKTPTICLVLPAFNEELTISETIRSFYAYIPLAHFVVVDNNSNDKTAEIAAQTFDDLNLGCRGTLLFEPKRGKANAIQKAFFEVESDIYIVADADMTYPSADVMKLAQPIIENKADMVIGDRHSLGYYKKNNRRIFHNFGNKIINLFVNIFFKANIKDVMSGFRAFSKRFVKIYPILVDGFEIETDVTIFALDKGFSIYEIPIEYVERPEGSHSKLNTFKDGFRVLATIFQALRFYKPLFLFSIFAFLFFTFAIISGIPVIHEFYSTGIVLHIPLAILAASFVILSMISFSIGIVLDSISHQNKVYFMDKFKNFSQK
jgi:glycosyltransferase involved in cell wall biosynthesis